MSTIDDFGGATESLDDPPLGGPLGWAAAVRTAIKNLQTTTATNTNDIAARWIIWTGSQAAYDGLGSYDPDTLYVVTS